MNNIMAALTCDQQCLVDVVDCTDHMADGGTKDTHYLVSQCIPAMEKLDNDGTLYAMAKFDVASNIQKGVMQSLLKSQRSQSSMEQRMWHPCS